MIGKLSTSKIFPFSSLRDTKEKEKQKSWHVFRSFYKNTPEENSSTSGRHSLYHKKWIAIGLILKI